MSIKKDFILPVAVLSFICLFISGTLAVVNSMTRPIIETAAAKRTEAAKKEIMPQADGFVLLDIYELRNAGRIPKTVTNVYRTTNAVGYIFMVTVIGYGGEIKLICGIDPGGRVVRTAVLEQTETQGLGTPIFEEPHAGQYWGRNRNGIEEVASVSGATITAAAFKNGIRDAFKAFELFSAHDH